MSVRTRMLPNAEVMPCGFSGTRGKMESRAAGERRRAWIRKHENRKTRECLLTYRDTRRVR